MKVHVVEYCNKSPTIVKSVLRIFSEHSKVCKMRHNETQVWEF